MATNLSTVVMFDVVDELPEKVVRHQDVLLKNFKGNVFEGNCLRMTAEDCVASTHRVTDGCNVLCLDLFVALIDNCLLLLLAFYRTLLK